MIRCDTCRRHIHQAESACPFCAAAPPRRIRSGLLAAGLTLLSGCPAPVDVYGAPPEPVDLGVDAAAGDGGADAQAAVPREALGARGAALASAFDQEKR